MQAYAGLILMEFVDAIREEELSGVGAISSSFLRVMVDPTMP